jgi:CDP-glucose 4,6-dehydratase
MSTLVTGAYGLVGYWLVEALLERGDEVVVLKRGEGENSALVREGLEASCSVFRGDITDRAALDAAMLGVDTVFHLAAQTIVGEANRSPVPTFAVNVMGTLEVMEAARRHEVARTVVAGSDQAYGPQEQLPYTEETPLEAIHPYGVSKAAADMIARSYWHTYSVPVTVARLPNVYGGGDANLSRLIPGLIISILEGRAPSIRSDGSPQRDFLHAQDAAAAYLALADSLGDGDAVRGRAFNGGADRPHSVREIVDALLEISGSDLVAEYAVGGVPRGEVDRQFVDSSRLRETTGWQPRVSLEDGLRRTYEWYRERHA